MTDIADLAAAIGEALQTRNARIAVAESCTGGLLANHFAAAPASSEWFLGGVVAYTKHVKRQVLGCSDVPVVSEQAVVDIAAGVGRMFDADVVASITGAAGPDPQDGQPPGTIWIGVRVDGATTTWQLHVDGDPAEVVHAAAAEGVRRVADALDVER